MIHLQNLTYKIYKIDIKVVIIFIIKTYYFVKTIN